MKLCPGCLERDRRILHLEKELARKRRSNLQNNYFHQLCRMISDHTGDHHESIKEDLKEAFLGVVDEQTGEIKVRGTHELDTQEFEDFLLRVRTWAAQFLGINLPLPGEF